MDKKADIIRAAQTLFSRFGLEKVTVDEIARDARVSKATLYKYFKDKGNIFDTVVRLETEQMLTAIEAAVEAEDTVVGKLRAHLLTKIAKINDLVNFYRVTQDSWSNLWPQVEEARKEFIDREMGITQEILRLGIESGELDIDDVALTAQIIISAQKTMEMSWIMNAYHISLKDYVDYLLKILLDGIRKR